MKPPHPDSVRICKKCKIEGRLGDMRLQVTPSGQYWHHVGCTPTRIFVKHGKPVDEREPDRGSGFKIWDGPMPL